MVKVLNTANHQGKANQNHNINSHPSEWSSSKRTQITNVDVNVRKGNTGTLLVGM